MNWSRFGGAFVQMELDSVKLVVAAWPNYGRRYYEDAEQLYRRWLSEMHEAGVASPTGLLMCLISLGGLASGRLSAPWRWAAALVTLAWAAGALQPAARTSGTRAETAPEP